MKKIACILISLLLIISCFSLYAFADAGVPQEVLDATESVIRVVSEYSDGYALGSGFVIKSDDQDTLIVTNHHVIADNPLSIAIFTESGIKVTVTVLLDDPEVDLCVLRLPYPNSQLHALVLNRDGIQRGAAVYAVGFPGAADDLALSETYSSETATITTGIISAIRTTYAIEGGRQFEMLQTTATINHGNSGGPLFDSSGYVVGINTYKAGESEGIFGAVSVGELIDLLTVNGISYRLPEPPKSVNVYVIIGAAAAALLLIAFIFLRLIRRKRRSEQIADNKNDLETQAEVFERDGSVEQNRATSKKPKEPFHIKRWHVFACVLAALLIALGLTAWQYGSRYQEAVKLADAGEFSKASDTLILPFVTKLHDQKLMDYLDAGKLFEEGQYEAAKEQFISLENYLNASDMVLEAQLQEGITYLNNKEYESAQEIFSQLFENSKKLADEKEEAILHYWASSYVMQNDLLHAYAVLELGKNLPTISGEIQDLQQTMYERAVSMYRSGDEDQRFMAYILFYTIYPYQQAEEYLILYKALVFSESKSLNYNNNIWNDQVIRQRCKENKIIVVEGGEKAEKSDLLFYYLYRREEIDKLTCDYNDLVNLIGFENTADIFLQNDEYTIRFIKGIWKSSDGTKQFSFEDENTFQSNLPFYEYENEWVKYWIYSGTMWAKHGETLGDLLTRTKEDGDKVFSFQLVDKNTIEIYCYKNYTTYTLNRR